MVTLLFYKGKGNWFDRAIRWWTKGKYSHCELQFSTGECFSADAWTNQVRFTSFEANPENWDAVELGLSAKDELLVRAWSDAQVGKGYDYLGAIGIGFPFVSNDPLRYFCSEVCVDALQRVGLLEGLVGSSVSPVQLARIYGLD